MKPARTRGHDDTDASRSAKLTQQKASFPSGHDGARRALSELRRMIDPERDRIRRDLRHLRIDELSLRHDAGHGWRDAALVRQSLVANAVAILLMRM